MLRSNSTRSAYTPIELLLAAASSVVLVAGSTAAVYVASQSLDLGSTGASQRSAYDVIERMQKRSPPGVGVH